jgi:hypothetical protein
MADTPDTSKDMSVYKHASTFTSLGRHVTGIRAILSESNMFPPGKVLDIGCSIFEPFYIADWVARLWPDACHGSGTHITAVDLSEDLIDILHRLNAGEEIPREEFVQNHTNNIQDDGSRRPNSDMKSHNPEKEQLTGIAKCVDELEKAGLFPRHYISKDHESFRGHRTPSIIEPVCADIAEFLSREPVDFEMIYAGTVLLNIKKATGHEKVMEIYKMIRQSLDYHGVFGMGTTPFDFYGERSCINELIESSFTPLWWAAENLLSLDRGGKKKLLGDYAVCSVGTGDDREARLTAENIELGILKDEYLQQVEVDRSTQDIEGLRIRLKNDSTNLVLAARREHKGTVYQIWEAPRAQLLDTLPPYRHVLPILGDIERSER